MFSLCQVYFLLGGASKSAATLSMARPILSMSAPSSHLAAPILAAGVRSRTVYLPGAAAVATAADGTGGSTKSAGGPAGGSAAAAAGVTWRHVFTNATYLGGKNYTIAAPLDSFPLFERVEARARQRAEDAE